MRRNYWGDYCTQTRLFWTLALEAESARLRDVYMRCDSYERSEDRRDYRNGSYCRSFQTQLEQLQLKIARTRRKVLPSLLKLCQRRAEEVASPIREAFLRGLSTRWDV
jgi:putative transposase